MRPNKVTAQYLSFEWSQHARGLSTGLKIRTILVDPRSKTSRLGLSLASLVAHYCRSLSRFVYHEATRSIATAPGWDASPSQVTSQHFVRFPKQFAGSHLYSWVERGALTTRPPRASPTSRKPVGMNHFQRNHIILM